jgi:hypothetical protein
MGTPGRSTRALATMPKFVRSPPTTPENVVWVAGGEVDEYHICLRFLGDDLDPDVLSSMLGAVPTSACRKGDIVRGTVSERVARTGRWVLDLPEKPGESFEPQIEELLGMLTQDLAVWRELTQKYRAGVVCGVWLRNRNRGMELSPELMKRLAERGLKLGLDIYADIDRDDG